jgi:hypothetical protein
MTKGYANYAGFVDKIGGKMFLKNGNNNTYKFIRYELLGICAGIFA